MISEGTGERVSVRTRDQSISESKQCLVLCRYSIELSELMCNSKNAELTMDNAHQCLMWAYINRRAGLDDNGDCNVKSTCEFVNKFL